MTSLLIAILLFLSICCASVFVAGAAMFCIGGHFCWQHIQRLRVLYEARPEAVQEAGPYGQGFKQVDQLDKADADKEFEEWMNNMPLR